MSNIKKIWVTEDARDCNTLSIRCYPRGNEFVPSLVLSSHRFPPTELVDGKRLSIDESNAKDLTEDHYTITGLSRDDLYKLYVALGEILRDKNA